LALPRGGVAVDFEIAQAVGALLGDQATDAANTGRV
jgi:hypothetical protein